MGLRPGYKEALEALSAAGVPTYIFSSGYGDIVGQVRAGVYMGLVLGGHCYTRDWWVVVGAGAESTRQATST